jgi:hypothetical protein
VRLCLKKTITKQIQAKLKIANIHEIIFPNLRFSQTKTIPTAYNAGFILSKNNHPARLTRT